MNKVKNMEIKTPIRIKACSHCRYWEYEDIDRGHVCVNDKSNYLAEWTNPDWCCDNFAIKQGCSSNCSS